MREEKEGNGGDRKIDIDVKGRVERWRSGGGREKGKEEERERETEKEIKRKPRILWQKEEKSYLNNWWQSNS